MLSGISVFSSDPVWRQILENLNATVVPLRDGADVDLDVLNLGGAVSALQLKAAILNAMDNSGVIRKLFGRDVEMPRLHMQIIACLDKSGGMSAVDLRRALGYSPNVATHAVDTAIYQMRRAYGHDFILNDNGVYKIGCV